jgi:TolB-like protein
MRIANPPLPVPPRREPRPAIAVLPFENLGGDPEQEYLSDGIAEDLLTRMARWELPVIARKSSFAYRGRNLDVRQIGRELGARYLVGGSVRRSGERMRLTVQLIDAETGEHVYAENFDRETGDVFALQDEIARAVAGSLGASLRRREESRALARDPESIDAWDALLRARWHFDRYTRPDWKQARDFARQATERDPRLARAHALLALVEHSGLANAWTDDPERSLAQALGAAKRAIELDARDAGAHLALGLTRFRAGEPEAARLAFERAIELEPENASTHGNLGRLLNATGAFDAAVPVLERAIDLDSGPSGARASGHPFWHFHLASAHFGAARDTEALRWLGRAHQLGDHALLHGLSAAVLAHLGRLEEARQHLAHLPGVQARAVEDLLTGSHRPFVERVLEGLRLAGMPG